MPKELLKGIIFDLDGVITETARIHALAWEQMFNDFLRKYAERKNEPFKPFDPIDDYQRYVDGKPRFEGVMSFLESRNIKLPYGSADDAPDEETIHGLGNRKNIEFQHILRTDGPEVIQSSVDFIHVLKSQGIRVAVASSSKNCKLVLELAGLEDLFETRVDGVVSLELNLKGKPNPDIFITAARRLDLWPSECVVVEDALSGVQAGRDGNFGLTIGIANSTDGQLLKQFGADVVVRDLSEICLEDIKEWFKLGIPEDSWNLSYVGFDPGDEKLRETLTTVGNGYLGTRGCFEGEKASFSFYPGTYIAGIYNKVPSEVHGRQIYNNDLVNCPNWTLIEFRIGSGDYMSPLSSDILSYSHVLNMKDGVMERTIVCRDKLGRITRIHSRRLASMANPHMCAIRYELTPLNYSEPITFKTSLDGNVKNEGVPRYRQLTSEHLSFVDGGERKGGMHLEVKTTGSDYHIVLNARTRFYENNRALRNMKRRVGRDGAQVFEEVSLKTRENRTYVVEKLVSITTSLDSFPGRRAGDFREASSTYLKNVKTFQGVLTPHIKAWQKLWDKADIRVTGDRFVQKIIRLHIYHLLATASPHNKNIDAGMPARGLHGEAYRGHIFWDELYILPFFDLHFPEVARSLLMYRYNRLDAAREYARENGYEGAMYPWQTADDGSEETQEVHYNPESKTWGPDLSRRQRHVSIAVFYNVWRYVTLTEDSTFMKDYGAEMLFEISRFWSSISIYDPSTDKYHIAGVMGPDEFHEALPDSAEPGLEDNAYTNIMVVWLMEKTLELLEELPKSTLDRIKEKVGMTKEEVEKWRDIIGKMNVIVTEDEIISQFKGYLDLKELDWDYYRERYYSIHRMDRILKAEGDSPDNYKVAKQADVLMMFYVIAPRRVREILNQLGHDVESGNDLLVKNYNYYEPRTSHGSTLSKVVHAVLSSYIHVDERPWNWFMESLRSDVFDTQGGTTQEGIHTGVMAGTVDVIMRCFARVNLFTSPIEIKPRLPEHWKHLTFKLLHKKNWYEIEINKKTVTIKVLGKDHPPASVKVLDKIVHLKGGEPQKIKVTETAVMKWSQNYLTGFSKKPF